MYNSDFLTKILGNNIIIKTSSGSSKVYMSKESRYICQEYLNPEISNRIASFMLKLNSLKNINYKNKIKKSGQLILDLNFSFDPFTYICPFQYYMINKYNKYNIIVWEKIVALNENLLKVDFLSKNYLKICYDISKALYSLKQINIIHNDCVLDNIGIYNGNFILFDFDGSGTPEIKNKDFLHDFKTLKDSFSYNGFDLPIEDFTGLLSVIIYVSNTKKINLQEAYDFLENLKIDF